MLWGLALRQSRAGSATLSVKSPLLVIASTNLSRVLSPPFKMPLRLRLLKGLVLQRKWHRRQTFMLTMLSPLEHLFLLTRSGGFDAESEG
jgi:hypothetical protein